MPRRAIIDRARLDAMLALPDGEAEVIRHYTLTAEDLAHVARRRRAHNRFGFALQLCALRYPGRMIRPGEPVPRRIVAHLCDQLDIEPSIAADYAARAPTRYEHLDAIRAAFGIRGFAQTDFREMSSWLLPVALATTRGEAVVDTLLSEHGNVRGADGIPTWNPLVNQHDGKLRPGGSDGIRPTCARMVSKSGERSR